MSGGVFESFYASTWQHPILLWAAALSALAFCATRSGLDAGVRRYCFALVALSLTDAWLTTTDVWGIGRLEGAAASLVPLFFVLAGDFRYLVLLGAADARGTLTFDGRAILAGLGWMLVVPVLSQAILELLPSGGDNPRVLFLVYEVLFFGLTCLLLARHPGHARAPWLRGVSRFVLVYYGLWATADAIILGTGSDLGFAVRVVPNVLYYGGLIAVIGATAASVSREGSAAG